MPEKTWNLVIGSLIDADDNGDGVDNSLARLLGAIDKDADATPLGLLSQNAGDLVLTFDCLSAVTRC